jgi:hypothetical protein
LHRISKVKVLVRMLWHSVTEGNCVAERRGGEQPEVNDQSVTQVNSIRPTVVASLPVNGEAQGRMAPKGRPQQCGPVSLTLETPETCQDDGRWLETE